MSSVWLATHGSGEDGDEWGVEEIFFTKETADAYAARPGREKWDHPDVCEWPVVGSFLTADERKAIERAMERLCGVQQLSASAVEDDASAWFTLRSLLERSEPAT